MLPIEPIASSNSQIEVGLEHAIVNLKPPKVYISLHSSHVSLCKGVNMWEIKPLVYLVGRFSRLQKGLCTVQSSVNFMFVITVWSKRPLLYCCCCCSLTGSEGSTNRAYSQLMAGPCVYFSIVSSMFVCQKQQLAQQSRWTCYNTDKSEEKTISWTLSLSSSVLGLHVKKKWNLQ